MGSKSLKVAMRWMYLLLGGLQYSSSANARATSSADEPAIEQCELAEHLPCTDARDLHDAIAGHVQRGRDAAFDDERHLPRVVALAPEDLTLAHRSPAHHLRQLPQIRLVSALEKRNGCQE